MKEAGYAGLMREVKKPNSKFVAMLAPSFAAEFDYPEIVYFLRNIGFKRVVELTFGAKMVNREYHKILKNAERMIISSTCPGIVEMIEKNYPDMKKNMAMVDSPMIATGKICRKIYPNYKIVFISPCNFKKTEASKSKYVDYVIDYNQVREMINLQKPKKIKKVRFDKFYNDYTKIYPLSGGLSKTAHLRGVIRKKEVKIIDGWQKTDKFLKNPDKKIKFLDCTFCNGGCIGGSFLARGTIAERKKRVLDYMDKSRHEDIPETRKGIIKKADGISFLR